MSDTNLFILIEAIDKAQKPLKETLDALKRMQNFQSKVDAVGKSMTNVGKAISVGITAPVVAGATLASLKFGEFETALANATRAADLSDAQAKMLGASMRGLSSELGISSVQLVDMATAGAKLGIGFEDLTSFVRVAGTSIAALEVPTDVAIDAFGKLKNIFDLTIPELELLGDSIAFLGNNFAVTEGPLLEATRRIAGVAKTSGFAATEVTALAAAFLQVGGSPEVVATSINSVLPRLQTATKQTDKFKRALNEMGLSAIDLESIMSVNARAGLDSFIQTLSQLDAQTRQGIVADLFGQGGDANAILAVAGSYEQFNKALFATADASQIAGASQNELAVMTDTQAFKLAQLAVSWENLRITIGAAISPLVKMAAEWLPGVVEGLQSWIENNQRLANGLGIALGVLAVVGPALIVVGTIVSSVAAILPALTGAFAAFGAVLAFLTGPVGIVIALVGLLAIAAYRIINNWGVVGPFLKSVWDGIVNIVQNAAMSVLGQVTGLATHVLSIIRGLGPQLFSAGAEVIGRLAAGIASAVGRVTEVVGSVVNRIRDMLPGSPVALGPLRVLNTPATNPGAEIVRMLSAGVESALPGLQSTLSQGLGIGLESNGIGAVPAVAGAGGGAAQGGGDQVTVNFSPQIAAGPGTDGAAIVQALRDYMPEFQNLMEDYFGERYRAGFS